MAAETLSIRLKRKARNADSGLFEWRPCSCSLVTRNQQLHLLFQTPLQDDTNFDRPVEILLIDVTTQLLNIILRKPKTRCDLEYYLKPNETQSQKVEKLELMASSVTQCQKWVTKVRQLQHEQHFRPLVTTSEPFPIAPLHHCHDFKDPKLHLDDAREGYSMPSVSISLSSSTVPQETVPCSQLMTHSQTLNPSEDSSIPFQRLSRSESVTSSTWSASGPIRPSSTWKQAIKPSISSPLSSSSSSSSSSSLSSASESQHSFQRHATTRREALGSQHNQQDDKKHESIRKDPQTIETCAHLRPSSTWFRDGPHTNDKSNESKSSSQAELHILQRVESALRTLELENVQAKTRERELVHELQTLQDAARVNAAERKHSEQEHQSARREINSWRREAEKAQAVAAQLQEQLGITREENRLLIGETLRLKRQNGDLRTQVHRLDSLVYGRF